MTRKLARWRRMLRVMDGMLVDLRFALSAPSLVPRVDVRLRSDGRRWVAVAASADHRSVGVGATARESVVNAVARFGTRAATELLADPGLLAPSTVVAGMERDRREAIGR